MITEIKGNIFESEERIYAQGCNCVGVMGAGFAKEIRQRHPKAYIRYKVAINDRVFNLGYAQFVLDEDNDRGIYNLATQKSPGANATYYGVKLAMMNMLEHAAANNITRIAMPFIGCGIGGLDWSEVKNTINSVHFNSGYEQSIVLVAYYL